MDPVAGRPPAALNGKALPWLIKETSLEADPFLLYQRLPASPFSFLLESSLLNERLGRYSFLGCRPFLVVQSKGSKTWLSFAAGGREVREGDPLAVLAELLRRYRLPFPRPEGFPPFLGGAVGYFAYDLGRHLERLPATAADDLDLPEMYLGFYDTVVTVDHQAGRVLLAACDPGGDGNRLPPAERLARLERALSRSGKGSGRGPAEEAPATRPDHGPESPRGTAALAAPGECPTRLPAGSESGQSLTASLPLAPPGEVFSGAGETNSQSPPVSLPPGDRTRALAPAPGAGEGDGAPDLAITANFSQEGYCRIVDRAREYIAAGDIFEVNLSQRLETTLSLDPVSLYGRLRRVNPAPFAALLKFPEVSVVSASPERFLQLRENRVETRPIKGTRPRGQDAVSDSALREELFNSPKDRAELTMIIDLERNDLGRVCTTGSVRVPEVFRLEEYASVFHLVSTVTGRLSPGRDIVDLLRASFPGGSITGAPKIRAMEIIEELEPVRRGIYTGAIGYLDFNGDADLNIVIRTFVLKGKRAYFQVGGAVTADSVPEAEYRETLTKAAGLVSALQKNGCTVNARRGGQPCAST